MKTHPINKKESKPSLTYESNDNISKQRTESRTNRKYKQYFTSTSSDEDEREFEKFIAQTTNYSNHSDNDNNNDNKNENIRTYHPSHSIRDLLKPKISKLSQYKSNLTSTLVQAKKEYSTFIAVKESNEKNLLKYKTKKERLKSIFNELKEFETNLFNKEKTIMKRQKEIERKNKEVIKVEKKLDSYYIKFNSYIEYKLKELKGQEKKNTKDKENNTKRAMDIVDKDKELLLRDRNIASIRAEVIKKETEFGMKKQLSKPKNTDRNKNGNRIITCLVDNQATLRKDVERLRNKALTQFDEATLDHLNNEIVYKKDEIELLNKQLSRFDNQSKTQYELIDQRLAVVNKGQTELARLKRDLQSKLREIEKKLTETKSLTNRLKEKSNFINHIENTKRLIRNKRYTYEMAF